MAHFNYLKSEIQYVLIDWVGGPDGKIFGPRWRRTDRAQRGPCAMTECQIFSRPARPNSVNKHFIIWASRFSSFFFFRLIKFAIGMFTHVAHFDRKVGIYIATKFFQFASRKEPYAILAGPDGCLRPCSTHRVRPSYGNFLNSFAMKARNEPYGSYDKDFYREFLQYMANLRRF